MIDPNVWIAALINPYGVPARVVEAVMTDQVTAVVSQHLLDKLAAVLVRPKLRRLIDLGDAVAFVETLGSKADLRADAGPPSRRVRDPDDDYLAALAEATDATLITGDDDLLDADLISPAITPRDLLDLLDEADEDDEDDQSRR